MFPYPAAKRALALLLSIFILLSLFPAIALAEDGDSHVHIEGDPVRENLVPASCLKAGSCEEVVYCEDCGEELSRTPVAVPAAGHTEGDPVTENVVAATEEADGSHDVVVYCAICGEELSRTPVTDLWQVTVPDEEEDIEEEEEDEIPEEDPGEDEPEEDPGEDEPEEDPGAEEQEDENPEENLPDELLPEEEEPEEPEEAVAFEESETIGDIVITVKAEAGVFPKGATLWVEQVPVHQEVEEALDSERDDTKKIAVSYTFDIRILDPDGNELQPAEGQTVSVSFAMAEVADENLKTNVYHVTEDEYTGELTAESLDVTQELTPETEEETTAVVETEGFSLYTVEFTYNTLQFVLEGDFSAPVSEILDAVGLTGTAEFVEVSAPNLFSVSHETGEWVVTSHLPFSSEEWMKVTINGIVYEIIVTDDPGDAEMTWTNLQETINNAENDSTIALTADLTAGETDSRILVPVGKNLTLDLNGHTLNRGLSEQSAADGYVIRNEGTLIVTDSSEDKTGTITGGSNSGDGGGIYNSGTLTITGGSVTGNSCGGNGGGIFNNSTLTIAGGSITGNSCGENGGGIHVTEAASIAVSGNPVVSGNTVGEAANNLYLAVDSRILVSDTLTAGASISVTSASSDSSVVITSGYGFGTKNTAHPSSFFHSDHADSGILLQETEAAIGALSSSVTYFKRSWSEENGAVSVEEITLTNVNSFPGSSTISGGWYYLDRNVTVNSLVSLEGDTWLILGYGKTLDVKGLYIPTGKTLTIYDQVEGTGRIYSHPDSGAGIGATSDNHPGGNVVIHGGTIEAVGHDHCAGIGSNDGNGSNVGNFTMYGGTVIAKGGDQGAGIGGGRGCDGGTIKIYGGSVYAEGKDSSAGIGGGDPSNNRPDTSTIEIYGGSITAIGNSKGAGIGGGEYGHANISISGGTVTATGGKTGGAGIGSGADGSGSTICITGGNISAAARDNGASGIGNGKNKSGSTVTLGYTVATKDSICITASSFSGTVTLENHFYNQNGGYESGVLSSSEIGKLADSTLRAWDGSAAYSWSLLQAEINKAPANIETAITLQADLTAGSLDSTLRIEGNRNITLDLNGHTLDRGFKALIADEKSNGVASVGSVLYVQDGSVMTIKDSAGSGIITGGFPEWAGGGVSCYGTLIMEGGIITGNRARVEGGGIYIHDTGILKLSGGSITANRADGTYDEEDGGRGGGGGIFCDSYGKVFISGGSVSDNVANHHNDSSGGGIYVNANAELTFSGGSINRNTASAGGGIYMVSLSKVEISGGEIIGNKAQSKANTEYNGVGDDFGSLARGDGGGICNCYGTLTVSGGVISDNSAEDGGGIRLYGGTTTVSGGEISQNTTYIHHGGGLCIDHGGKLDLSACNITGNSAKVLGGGIYVDAEAGNVNVSGSPVVNENSAEHGKNIYLSSGKVLTVPAAFASGADLNVFTQAVPTEAYPVRVTGGYRAKNPAASADAWIHAEGGDRTKLDESGEIVIYVRSGEISYIKREWNADRNIVVEGPDVCDDYTLVKDGTHSRYFSDGWYVFEGTINYKDRLEIRGSDVNFIITDGAEVNAKEGIKVAAGNSLYIWGQTRDSGRLTVNDADDGAGIGGNDGGKGGNIIINGANVVVEGDGGAAGIGGGSGSSSGFESITINGGIITATGGSNGAGIGSGKNNPDSKCGTITIHGGTITAKGGGSGGAGIGGGQNQTGADSITITGGTITARGTDKGAAIGGGDGGIAPDILISGGTVHATSGDWGAAIGGGEGKGIKSITITGGEVRAICPERSEHTTYNGAGIGSGGARASQGGTITISGGDILAISQYGAGIGGGGNHGGDGGVVNISGGSVDASSQYGAGIGGGGDSGSNENSRCGKGGTVTITGGNVKAQSMRGAGIGGGAYERNDGGASQGGEVTIRGGQVFAYSAKGGAGIGGSIGANGGDVTVYGGTLIAAAGKISYNWLNEVSPSHSAGDSTADIVATLTNFLIKLIFDQSKNVSGAAIGGGFTGNGGRFYYLGGTVIARSGSDKTPAIGAGTDGKDKGSISLKNSSGNALVYYSRSYEEENPPIIAEKYERDSIVSSKPNIKITACNHPNRYYDSFLKWSHVLRCHYCALAKVEAHAFISISNDRLKCTVCGFVRDKEVAQIKNNPTAKTGLVYNGKAQKLLDDPGRSYDGKLWYAVSTDGSNPPTEGFSKKEPTAVEAGTYYVWYKIVGSANYKDSDVFRPLEVEIRDSLIVSLEPAFFTYNGNSQKPTVSVYKGLTALTNEDYSASFSNDTTNAGTVTVTVNAGGSYNQTLTAEYTIRKAPLTEATLDKTSLTFTGATQTVNVTGVKAGDLVVASDDYNVQGNTATRAGRYTVTVTPKEESNYTGTAKVRYTILPKAISDLSFSLSGTGFDYTGAVITPGVTVMDGESALVEERDFSVTYEDNLNAGTAKVVIHGLDNYSGSKDLSFTISKKALDNAVLTLAQDLYFYDGTAKTPAVTLKDGSTTLIKDSDYTVSYTGNTQAGKATVTVTGIGNYSGSRNADFYIVDDSAISTEVTVKSGAPETESSNIQTVARSLFSDAELIALAMGGKAKVWLEISPLTEVPAKDKSVLEAKAKERGAKIGAWFDISLYRQIGTGDAEILHETPEGNAMQLSVEVPKSMQNKVSEITRTFYLIRCHNGTAKVIAETTGTTLTGQSDRFSSHAIAYKDSITDSNSSSTTGKKSTSPNTGDESSTGLWIALACVGAAGLIGTVGALARRRRKKK